MIQSAHVKNLTLTVLCAAVLAACGGGGSSTVDKLDTQLNNVHAAQTVSAQIAALATPENLTVNDEAAVNSAAQAYNKLPDAQKAYISSESVAALKAAIEAVVANREAAAKVTGTVNSLPDTAAEIDTPAEEKLLTDANTAYSALTDNQKTWLAAQTEKKLSTLAATVITDNNSLAPLNLPAPLHTAFISSSGAQQHNPHMQLRTVDGKPALRDDQIGLIRTLAINPNASVIVDGAVLSSDQSFEYRTPASGSTKVSSAGNTLINTNDDQLRQDIQETMDTLAFYKKDKNGLVFDKAFDGVYIIQFTDGTRIVLHDPAAAGWTYQTFAHYVDPKNGVTHGYQSIGDETTDMPTSGTATYKGITTAYLTNNGNNDRQLTANVTAVADFAKRALRFSTDNSQIHALDVNGKRVSTAAAGYDLRANATWAEGGNSFKGDAATVDKNMGGSLNGKFFGGAAAEIGGTYGLKSADGNTQLIGGYGAKRP
ncbi:transferrin-binding protein-like solute binding protein [Neisseria sp.]|uniref:transferrin-binding protein-like solute binding protein n=1 Tax=Neisseria sp. TaxID=192066 RepID=UPI00289A49CC|nr:transferrin-binding protein-like solute binding protein [Neisseria sp.]